MEHRYKVIPLMLSNKEGWTTDTCYNINNSQNNSAERSEMQNNIVYDFFTWNYRKCKLVHSDSSGVAQRGLGGRDHKMVQGNLGEVMDIFIILAVIMVS